MAMPPPLTELKLPPALKQLVNSALARGKLISVGYVGENGRPELSFRGSVQAFSDTQLAIWVRSPTGGLVDAIAKNPNIALLYGDLDPSTRAFLTFHGRGRIDNSPATRRVVYSSSNEQERERDKEQKGVPLIIDLDTVDGFFDGTPVKMRR
jgi:hypothetical protein